MGACSSTYGHGRDIYRDSDEIDAPTAAGGVPFHRDVRTDAPVENHRLHQGAILGLASANIGEFLTCGEDKTLRLHQHSDGTGVFETSSSFVGHTKAVSSAVYGKGTDRVYSCSRDTTIRQWGRPGEPALNVLDGHTLACTALSLSLDETSLWSGSRDASVKVWDVESGSCTAQANVPRNLVTCLKHLPTGTSSAAQGGEDLRLRIWDARKGCVRPALTIHGYTFFPLALAVSADGREVLTSSKGFDCAGCEAKLWDLRHTKAPVREFIGHTHDVTACLLVEEGHCRRSRGLEGAGGRRDERASGDRASGDGDSVGPRLIVTASKDETVKVFDLATGDLVADHAEPHSGGYTGLAHEYDDSTGHTTLYASTMTGGLYAYRMEAGSSREEDTPRPSGAHGSIRLRCVGFVQGLDIV